MAGDHNLAIGALSRRSGVHVETIRYYEKIALLPAPPRTGGGHRVYSDAHVKRLAFIRRSRELGFTLEEIRNLLRLVEAGAACSKIKETALVQLKEIRRKIADLQRMESTLTETAASCHGGEAPDCPILDVLSRE